MRGALNKLDGVEVVGRKVGEKNFEVKYDKSSVSPKAIAMDLEKAGEPATVK